jgi:hypothetical protein
MFVAAGGRCGDAKLPVTMYETTTKSDGRIAYNKSAAGGIAVATQICCATATCQTFLCRHTANILQYCYGVFHFSFMN